MRTVVYDHETYEPITVIEVPGSFLAEIESGKRGPILVFPTRPIVSTLAPREDISPTTMAFRTVRLRFEPIYKGQARILWLATTDDGETALLLRSAFLPGQQHAVQEREQTAFLKGLVIAIG